MNNQENIGIKKELEKQQKVQTVITTLLLGNNCYNFFEVQHFYNLIEQYEKMEDLENNQEFKELSEDRKEFLLEIRKIKEEYTELTDKEFKFMLKHYYNPLDYLKENPSLEPRVEFIYYNNNGNEEKQKELEQLMEELNKQGITPIVYDIQLIKSLNHINIKETVKDSYLLEVEKVKEMIEYKNVFDAELLKFESDFYPLTNEKYDNLKNKISEIMIKTGSDLTVRHILKTMEYMKFTQELLFEKNIKKSIEEYNKLSSNINENEKIDFMKSKLIKIFGENFKYRIGKSTSLNFQGDTLIENIDNKTIEELFKLIILNDQNFKNEFYDQNLDLLRYQNIVGAGLHDIGKIVVGQELLDGAIKFVDFSIRNKYILNSHDDFSKFFISDKEFGLMASGHHGKENLKESNQISMITMVDMFDALVSPRSYKSGVLLENNEENLKKNMKELQEVLEKFDKYEDIKINGITISNIRKNIEENIKKFIFKEENHGDKNYKEYLGNIILFSEMKNLIYKKTLETKNIDENEHELFKKIFNDIKNLQLIDDVPNIILRNPDINSEIFEIFIENFDLYKIKFLENFKLNLEHDIQYFIEKEKEIIKEINNAKMEEITKIISSPLNQNDVKELQDIFQHFSNLNKSEFEKLDDNLKYVLEFLEENKIYKTHNFTNFLDKNNDTKNEEKLDNDSSNLLNKLKENQLFSKIMEIVNFKHGNMKINDLVENIDTKENLQPSKLYLKLKEYFVNSTAMEENLKVSLTNLELIETNLKLDNPKLIDTDKKEHLLTILKARERIEIELNEFMNNQPKTSQYMVMNF